MSTSNNNDLDARLAQAGPLLPAMTSAFYPTAAMSSAAEDEPQNAPSFVKILQITEGICNLGDDREGLDSRQLLEMKLLVRRLLVEIMDIAPKLKQLESNIDKKKRGAGARKKASDAPKVCLECHTTDSAEWRTGPSGRATLCNACGLRYWRKCRKLKKGAALARLPAGGPLPALVHHNAAAALHKAPSFSPYPADYGRSGGHEVAAPAAQKSALSFILN